MAMFHFLHQSWHRVAKAGVRGSGAANPRCRQPIGLPRTLFYHLHPGAWETFFQALAIPVVLSAPTARGTVERASLISEPEHCLPVKMLDAHVFDLIGKVPRIFLPRILSTRAGYIACPKLAAVPDAVRAQHGRHFEVVTIDVDENQRPLVATLTDLGRQLGFAEPAARQAAENARQVLAQNQAAAAPPAGPAAKRYLLIGHPYNLQDRYFVEPICRKLAELGVLVERMAFARTWAERGPLRWDANAEMLARLQEVTPQTMAGVIQLTSFNCGCDSMASVYYREILKQARVPYLALTLDAHAAQAGLDTRLEAFVDSTGGAW